MTFVMCPVCGRRAERLPDGTVGVHWVPTLDRRTPLTDCPGTGRTLP